MAPQIVPAAGIVALKTTSSGAKALMVHRPKYDDWVLPKGHVEAGELLPETACREFHEETGYKAVVVQPITRVDYPVGDTIKRVSWFLGRLATTPQDNVYDPHEVSQVQWRRLDKALKALTYENERDVLVRAAEMRTTCPILIVRHAKALDRETWHQDDALRPLAERGQQQAKQLAQLFSAYGVRALVASPSTRCMQTLQPYADAAELVVEPQPGLSEKGASSDPAGVAQIMANLRTRVLDTGVPLAVCSHRPVLPLMVDGLGVDGLGKIYTALKPGEVMVAHLDATKGGLVELERYASTL